MNEDKTILILGGGVGGLVTANLLRKKVPKKNKIILFEKNANHLFQPSLVWLITDDRKSENISKPLSKLEKKGIQVIQGNISQIDCESKEIVVNDVKYKGDYIVIALGAELVPETISGLPEGGFNIWSLKGAEQFRDAWKNFDSGKLVVLTSTPVYKCPAAPYEVAMLLRNDPHKKKTKHNIQVELYSAEPGPMGVTGIENSTAVRQMVEQQGVKYFPEHQIESVNPDLKKINFSNGLEVKYDLLAFVPPHSVPNLMHETKLVGESGWVDVDKHTLETKFSDVFAIGDITGIPLSVGKPLPKAGVFAHNQAKVVANNIAVKINGKGKTSQYNGNGECFVETGKGKAGIGRGNFYAEPRPQVKMYKPRRIWHWAKVFWEKRWLSKWF